MSTLSAVQKFQEAVKFHPRTSHKYAMFVGDRIVRFSTSLTPENNEHAVETTMISADIITDIDKMKIEFLKFGVEEIPHILQANLKTFDVLAPFLGHEFDGQAAFLCAGAVLFVGDNSEQVQMRLKMKNENEILCYNTLIGELEIMDLDFLDDIN